MEDAVELHGPPVAMPAPDIAFGTGPHHQSCSVNHDGDLYFVVRAGVGGHV